MSLWQNRPTRSDAFATAAALRRHFRSAPKPPPVFAAVRAPWRHGLRLPGRDLFSEFDQARAAARIVLAVVLAAAAAVAPMRSVTAGEAFLDRFPIVVHLGVAASPPGSEVLPDLPFDRSRGYGHIGGRAVERQGTAAFGGDPEWPIAWRENPRKYTFHLRNGDYLLRLYFLETDVAIDQLRSFDIEVEGRTVYEDFDIAREAGAFRWLSVDKLVSVHDGWLDVNFIARPESLPPRVARIHIKQAAETPPVVSQLQASGRFRSVFLRWQPDFGGGSAGYGVFRAESLGGPYESLTDTPVLTSEYVDRHLYNGAPYYYRVRAYGVGGGQSSLSAPVEAASRLRPHGDLRVFDLQVAPKNLAALSLRQPTTQVVKGKLLSAESTYKAEVSALTSLQDWQFKRSFRIDLRKGERFLGRKSLLFLADPGDPTCLREDLFWAVHDLCELAAPRVEQVHLLLNGEYLGRYLDCEVLDRRFRNRNRLDRVGDFARLQDDGFLRHDWLPYGEGLDRQGSLWSLTLFIQQMNRLNEGEMDSYFGQSFYLERLIDRLAVAAVLGRTPGEVESRVFLGDSRNGRWQFFTDRAPEGALGVTSFRRPLGREVPDENVEWALNGPSLRGVRKPFTKLRVLETRLFNRPKLWQRYLDRIEEICRQKLTPEAFEELIAEPFKQVAAAFPEEVRFWPDDGGATFRKGPQELLAHFENHRQKLLERIAEERSRPPQPVVLSEFLLRPSTTEKPAWVEIVNRSAHPVRLDSYCLSADPEQPLAWRFPGETLDPGAYHLVNLESEGSRSARLRASPSGGSFLLSKVDSEGEVAVVDAVFYGHQTEGFSYSRLAEDQWEFSAEPTPGSENRSVSVEPPPWRYRWEARVTTDGALEISVRPSSRVDVMSLLYRKAGEADFRSLKMPWEETHFRYLVTVPSTEAEAGVPFYFLATAENGLQRPYPLTGQALPFYFPTRPQLFLNEVLPRPIGSNALGEFVEVYNAGDEAVSIRGMFLTDSRRNPRKWRIPLEEPIPPKGFAVIYADGKGRGIHAPFKLGNSGEYLGLYHRLEEGNVLVDHIAYSAVPANKSWGRRRDGKKGGRVWKDPTPGEKNLPKIPEEYLRRRTEERSEEDIEESD